jgi:hypothetical protein
MWIREVGGRAFFYTLSLLASAKSKRESRKSSAKKAKTLWAKEKARIRAFPSLCHTTVNADFRSQSRSVATYVLAVLSSHSWLLFFGCPVRAVLFLLYSTGCLFPAVLL